SIALFSHFGVVAIETNVIITHELSRNPPPHTHTESLLGSRCSTQHTHKPSHPPNQPCHVTTHTHTNTRIHKHSQHTWTITHTQINLHFSLTHTTNTSTRTDSSYYIPPGS